MSTSAGTAAKPIFWEFLRLYPSPELAVQADLRDLASLLNPLGLHEKRAQIIIKFTGQIIVEVQCIHYVYMCIGQFYSWPNVLFYSMWHFLYCR